MNNQNSPFPQNPARPTRVFVRAPSPFLNDAVRAQITRSLFLESTPPRSTLIDQRPPAILRLQNVFIEFNLNH